MKAAKASDIKKELVRLPPADVIELCLRLSRFKKENKELLTYLLFEANDEDQYVQSIKDDIQVAFTLVNTKNKFQMNKSVRKILRTLSKYIRFTGSKTVEADLLLFFCRELKTSNLPMRRSPALLKLYESQLKKIETIIASMHEDLHYDYTRQLQAILAQSK